MKAATLVIELIVVSTSWSCSELKNKAFSFVHFSCLMKIKLEVHIFWPSIGNLGN